MQISRIVRNFFTPKVFEEKIEKVEKAFSEILEEEHARLMQLVNESRKNGIPVQLYQKYKPDISDRMFFDE